MNTKLEGRVALVFGAGACAPGWSNGKAASVAYARAGASVVAVDIVAERAAETLRLVEEEDAHGLAIRADASSAAEVRGAVEATLQRFGRIDILHNNVGIPNVDGRMDLDEAHWDRILDTNLKSVYLACAQVLPVMLGQKRGVITNISSGASIKIVMPQLAAAAHRNAPQLGSLAAYSASKAGLNQFTRAVAVMYAAHGIRSNAILPINIDTPRIRGYGHMVTHFGSEEHMLEARHAMSLTGKMGSAWDIANASVFLASDEANYINGVLLPVDGALACV